MSGMTNKGEDKDNIFFSLMNTRSVVLEKTLQNYAKNLMFKLKSFNSTPSAQRNIHIRRIYEGGDSNDEKCYHMPRRSRRKIEYDFLPHGNNKQGMGNPNCGIRCWPGLAVRSALL